VAEEGVAGFVVELLVFFVEFFVGFDEGFFELLAFEF